MDTISKNKYSLIGSLALVLLITLAVFTKVADTAPPDVPPGLEIAIDVLEEHTPNLMTNPEVTGTAVGLDDNGV